MLQSDTMKRRSKVAELPFSPCHSFPFAYHFKATRKSTSGTNARDAAASSFTGDVRSLGLLKFFPTTSSEVFKVALRGDG
mmetsp:Transcript_8522/g.22756  ORF Transcript_8522/g.22756 Transcript_8522/m.22756 type:complete len:80 (+) Transcript_8522:1045-1284(+)